MSVYVGEKQRALRKCTEKHDNNNSAVAVIKVRKKNHYHLTIFNGII